MISLTSLCLLASFALNACVAAPSAVPVDEATEKRHSLEAELASGGLDDPRALSGLLGGLGLHMMQDMILLNGPEQLELAESLRAGGVTLGSRSKLRLLADRGAEETSESAYAGMLAGTALSPRRVQGVPAASPRSNDVVLSGMTSQRRLQEGVSSDSIALMATAALGILSFVVQGRVSASEAKHRADLDRGHALREKEQAQAGKLLERVQQQMSEVVVSVGNTDIHRTRVL